MSRWLVLVLMIFYCSAAKGQLSGVSFSHFGKGNGLSDDYVQCMAQDSIGYLWIGAAEGLFRFDGRQFINYTPDGKGESAGAGLNITGMVASPDSGIFFCSNGNLYKTQFGRRNIIKCFADPASPVNSIAYINDLHIAICNNNKMLLLDFNFRKVDSIVIPETTRSGAITATSIGGGSYFISNLSYHFIYNSSTKVSRTYAIAYHMDADKQITLLRYADAENGLYYFSNFWYGLLVCDSTGKLVAKLDNNTKPSALSSNHISYVMPFDKGSVLVGTYKEGINLLHTRSGKNIQLKHTASDRTSLASNEVLCALKDRDGQIWIGTTKGICRLRNKHAEAWWWPVEGNITGIVKTPGNEIIAAYYGTGTLMRINEKMQQVNSRQLSNPLIWSIINNQNKLTISGSGKSIVHLKSDGSQVSSEKRQHQYFIHSDVVVLSARDSRGDEWYSGNQGGGILRITNGGKQLIHYSAANPGTGMSLSYVNCFADDLHGNVWFASNRSDKLVNFDRSRQIMQTYDADSLLQLPSGSVGAINDLHFFRGHLVIASQGNGVFVYDPDKRATHHYTQAEGLPGNFVHSIVTDSLDNIWVATSKGLAFLSKGFPFFSTVLTSQGLPSQGYFDNNGLYDADRDLVWMAGNDYLVAFKASHMLKQTIRPMQVLLDGLQVNGDYRSIKPGEKLVLEAHENNLQIFFSANDLMDDRQVEYAFKLGGVQRDWQYTGTTAQANFLSLGPGEYHLGVKARHTGNAAWVMLPVEWEFQIATPWYASWWFLTLAALALIGLVFLFIRLIFRRHLDRQQLQMEKELAVSEERNRLARELHDGLGSMLSGIKYSLSAVQRHHPEKSDEMLAHSIDNLDVAISGLRNISHNMMQVTGMEDLQQALLTYCTSLEESTGINIKCLFYLEEKQPLPEAAAFHLFRIVQELLQNSIRHANPSEIIVQVNETPEKLLLTVEDNGSGFVLKQALKGKGIGLKSIVQRVKAMHGKVDIDTKPGDGCSVMLELPLSAN